MIASAMHISMLTSVKFGCVFTQQACCIFKVDGLKVFVFEDVYLALNIIKFLFN